MDDLTEVPPPNTFKNSINPVIAATPAYPAPSNPTTCRYSVNSESAQNFKDVVGDWESSAEEEKKVTKPDYLLKRIEQSEKLFMERFDALTALVIKSNSNVVTEMEKYATTVSQNNALMDTLSQLMKEMLSSDAFKPKPVIAIVPEEQKAQAGGGDGGDDFDISGGGYGYDRPPIPTQFPSHETTRISSPEELARIKEEGLLKHCWIYVSSLDSTAYKIRLKSLTPSDVTNVYNQGGCIFPYIKSCLDWESYTKNRIAFETKKHYSHCREKLT